jgi:hypothetical protein
MSSTSEADWKRVARHTLVIPAGAPVLLTAA